MSSDNFPKNISHYELMKGTQKKNFIDRITDSVGEEWHRSVGHVSLSIDLENGRSEYLSFWPEIGTKDITLLTGQSARGVFMKSIEDDMMFLGYLPGKRVLARGAKYSQKALQEYGLRPSESITLTIPFNKGLSMWTYIRQKKNSREQYNLYRNNCSNAVMEVLKGLEKIANVGLTSRVKGIYKRSEEMAKLLTIIQNFTHRNSAKDLHQLSYIVNEQGFSLPTSIASFIESIGGSTPSSVQRYTKVLQKSLR